MDLINFDFNSFSDALDKSRKSVKKSIKKSKWRCCQPDCNCNAINSHIIQQNPLLKSICDENNKVLQFCDNDLHPNSGDWDLNKFKLFGISEAMSMPLFCGKHDVKIFKEIETHPVNYYSPRVQLLLSYRSTCGQRFLEQKRYAEYLKRCEKYEIFNGCFFKEQINVSEYFINRITSNISKIWEDLCVNSYVDYCFRVFEINNWGICASDCSVSELDFDDKLNDITCVDSFKVVYLQILPQIGADKSILIIGTDKNNPHPEFEELVSLLEDANSHDKQINIVYRLLVMINNFAMNPKLFETEKDRQKFLDTYICNKFEYINKDY